MVDLRPLILIRGFGGPDTSDDRASGYQGFNDGTVYPERRGENYIYEGFVLRAMKSDLYHYRDATNVIGYYPTRVEQQPTPAGVDPADAFLWHPDLTAGTVVVDPLVARHVLAGGVAGTIWIYRYYDLSPRTMDTYGAGLVRLVDLIATLAAGRGEPFRGVDMVAHSMGGLVVRSALRSLPPERLHRVVTLGTPHRGIAFQHLPSWLTASLPSVKAAHDELDAFDPSTKDHLDVPEWSLPRTLTVVGTEYRTYGPKIASFANRLSTLRDEGTLAYNRSDGLVKQASAQLPGAPRTFVHKCHGGADSLVTSREAYEIAMRFFHGTHHVRLWLDHAEVTRGRDFFGRSEFYLGVSIKPRYVDFELVHQSPEANNCYGPFSRPDLDDELPDLHDALRECLDDAGDRTHGWAAPGRMAWEGWIDHRARPSHAGDSDTVFRLDVYLGERDSFGLGFSDNVVFRKQYYVQGVTDADRDATALFIHTGEKYLGPHPGSTTLPGPEQVPLSSGPETAGYEVTQAVPTDGATGEWTFWTAGTGFNARWRIAFEPERDTSG